jgi:hypothetical protein
MFLFASHVFLFDSGWVTKEFFLAIAGRAAPAQAIFARSFEKLRSRASALGANSIDRNSKCFFYRRLAKSFRSEISFTIRARSGNFFSVLVTIEK